MPAQSHHMVVDPMHIIDGILSLPVILFTFCLTAALWFVASLKSKSRVSQRQIPLLAVVTAFIFIAQMINFPIFGDTSGHLLGAALVAILLGPYASMMSMTVVLFIQAFMFGDGGVSALGANILNMGIIATYSAYIIYRLISGSSSNRMRISASIFAAGYASIVLGAVTCGLEIGFSGALPLELIVPTMLFWYALIGLIEGFATMLILTVLLRYRDQLLGPLLTSEVGKRIDGQSSNRKRQG